MTLTHVPAAADVGVLGAPPRPLGAAGRAGARRRVPVVAGYVLVDVLAAGAASVVLRGDVGGSDLSVPAFGVVWAALAASLTAIGAAAGAYPDGTRRRAPAWHRVLGRVIALWGMALGAGFSLAGLPVSAGALVAALAASAVVAASGRHAVDVAGRATARERSAPVLLIGAGPDVVTFARELCSAEAIDIAGLAADAVDAAYDGEVPLRGSILDAPAIARELGVATALIVCAGVDGRRLSWLVRRLTLDGVWVELCPSVGGLRPSRLSVSSLGRYQVLTVAPAPHDAAAAWCKRAFDLAVAVVLLAAALPLLAVAAVAIKLDSPGPVLFRQTRLGRGARPFSILKLRTMSAGDHSVIDLRSQGNDADGPLFKLRRDPRVTRVGAVLRRYSLDELPQLWNVIRDDMSLIGPRPALQSEADLWELEIYDRLRVKPGITGMWQVSGRSDLSFEEYVRLDLYYVDNWSLRIDLAILLKTLPAVFGSRGAY